MKTKINSLNEKVAQYEKANSEVQQRFASSQILKFPPFFLPNSCVQTCVSFSFLATSNALES